MSEFFSRNKMLGLGASSSFLASLAALLSAGEIRRGMTNNPEHWNGLGWADEAALTGSVLLMLLTVFCIDILFDSKKKI